MLIANIITIILIETIILDLKFFLVNPKLSIDLPSNNTINILKKTKGNK